jgi:putative hydrolase of the HAD superfamily
MAQDQELKVLLFDLGGVLLKLNDPVEIFGLKGDEVDFKERWLRSPSVRTFESGVIDTEEFAKRVVVEADLPYDWQEFIKRFDAWPGQLYEETIGVLEAIPRTYSRALLSNINKWHWGREEISGRLSPHLDRTFLSFETGFVKPDREAFDLVVNTYECQPQEILFFDDTPSSVSAAADFGIHAMRAVGIDAVKRGLVKYGVLA